MKILPFIIALIIVLLFGLWSRLRQRKLYRKSKAPKKDIDKLKNYRRTNIRRVK